MISKLKNLIFKDDLQYVVGKLNTLIKGKSDIKHNHEEYVHKNIDALNSVSTEKVGNWDEAYSKEHDHTNKEILDGITTEKIKTWDEKASHSHENIDLLNSLDSEKVNNWDEAYSKEHNHGNKEILDGISEGKVNNWDEAYSKEHDHSNKEILDGITDEDITNWNRTGHTHDNKEVLDAVTSDTLVSVTQNTEARHSHVNKSAIDGITDSRMNEWDEAYSKEHDHDNKEILDGITDEDITNWNRTGHTHDNKEVLDAVTSEEIEKWNNDSHIHENMEQLDSLNSDYMEKLNELTSNLIGGDNKSIIKTDGETDVFLNAAGKYVTPKYAENIINNELASSESTTYSSKKIEERIIEVKQDSESANTLQLIQKVILNATSTDCSRSYPIPSSTNGKLIVQPYKFVAGESNIVQTLKTYDNTDAENFYYNKDVMRFDESGMTINDQLVVNFTKEGDYYVSDEINLDEFV